MMSMLFAFDLQGTGTERGNAVETVMEIKRDTIYVVMLFPWLDSLLEDVPYLVEFNTHAQKAF